MESEMKTRSILRGFICLIMLVFAESFKPFNVTYDHRALIIDGQRRMLISAGIHYPRATPQMWPNLISMSKQGGADVIQTYTFWNGHEPVKGQYNFAGRYDLVKFVKLVHAAGLYLHLRIGPYVCAEWNFGGFPVWLRDIPDIQFRTDNAAFKKEMEKYVTYIVNLMKEHNLLSWQGGPIILLQIENEYGNVESSFGIKGKQYVKWASNLAIRMNAGVPWVMCQQHDAPSHIIDSCNGFYCDGFKPNSYHKPALWTEDWNGWYASWGGLLPHRPVEDNAFAVARFFQRGGSFQNYYMYFGGTNFGRTAGGPFLITSYDYDAPIDEYGILREPKWGHLKDLHAAIKLCEPALISVDDSPKYISLGPQQEAHVYNQSKGEAKCSAFLANIDRNSFAKVHFNGETFNLPPWSVSVLPDCRNVIFNTAKINTQTSLIKMKMWTSFSSDIHITEQSKHGINALFTSNNWSSYKEPIGAWSNETFSENSILEHLNVTKDSTDYLWYITSVNITESEAAFWIEKNQLPCLIIDSVRDIVRVFVNGKLAGSTVGSWVRLRQDLNLTAGQNEIAILSETLGLQNYGAFLEKDGAGFRGHVSLEALSSGTQNLDSALWTYQTGLQGEHLQIYSPDHQDAVEWLFPSKNPQKEFFTWYKTLFDAPPGADPVALDLNSMGKGQVWVNGNSLGRYWASYISPKTGCNAQCDYRGTYNQNKCRSNCGEPTQRWYHIPRSWLQAKDNLLVLFEEEGGNPEKISIDLRVRDAICATVSETHPPPIPYCSGQDCTATISSKKKTPKINLHCDIGETIHSISFASFGNPKGACGNYLIGNCHANSSSHVVFKACQGKNSCTIPVSVKAFGEDPCPGIEKTLAIQVECTKKTPSSAFVQSF